MTPAFRSLNDGSRRTLNDLLGFAKQAARLVEDGKQRWDEDEFHRLAGEAILHKIGEAVTRLDRDDPELVSARPEVRWRPMKGMRNVIAHRYGVVDYDIVWNALKVSLPGEVRHIRCILAESE